MRLGSCLRLVVGIWFAALSVCKASLPLDILPLDTFILSTPLASGIFSEYFRDGRQLVANQVVQVPIDVFVTAGSADYTVRVTNKSANWPSNCELLSVPAGTLLAVGPGPAPGPPTSFNVSVSASCAATVPPGYFMADIQITESGQTAPSGVVPFSLTVSIGGGSCFENYTNCAATLVFGTSTSPQQDVLTISSPAGADPLTYTATYIPNNLVGYPLPSSNVRIVGPATGTVSPGSTAQVVVEVNPAGLAGGVYSGQWLVRNKNGGAPPNLAGLPLGDATIGNIIVYIGDGLGVNWPPGGAVTIRVPAGYQASELSQPFVTNPIDISFLSTISTYAVSQPALNITSPASGLPPGAVTIAAAPFAGLPQFSSTFSLTVDSTFLSRSTVYTGTLTFARQPNTVPSLVLPFTLQVTAGPELTTSVGGGSFYSAFKPLPPVRLLFTLTPGSQTTTCLPGPTGSALGIGSTGGTVSGVTLTTPASTPWLFVNKGSDGLPTPLGPFAATPQIFPVMVCVDGSRAPQAAGSYASVVQVSTADGSTSTAVPVTLVVGSGPPAPAASQIATLQSLTGTPFGQFAFDTDSNYAFDVADQFRFFGLSGDVPVSGDWGGNGTTSIGVFRCPPGTPAECQWYLDLNNNASWDGTNGGDGVFNFGLPGDIPVVGDWTGDGKSKFGVFRCPPPGLQASCTFILDAGNKKSWDPATVILASYGLLGDYPVVNNWYNNSNVDQVGVFRCPAISGPGLCSWIVDANGSLIWEPSDPVYFFGLSGDVPVVGNWNGTGPRRIGVYRKGTWIFDSDGNHVFSVNDQLANFGLPGDKPVVGFWTWH